MTAPRLAVRSYPTNSSHAAGRIVALALIVDGEIGPAEAQTLEKLEATKRLGLTPEQWDEVVHDLCADLLGPARLQDEGCIPAELLEGMLDELDNVALRRLVLRLSSAVVHADGRIDEGESLVLVAAMERWGFLPDDPALLEPMMDVVDTSSGKRQAPSGDCHHPIAVCATGASPDLPRMVVR